MKEPISVNGAQITTVTVDIEVIRIGSKQMTLAVFRQLQNKDIFDDDGNLVAPPWGWVNHNVDWRGIKPFVFSYEGVLYRKSVDLKSDRILTVVPEKESVEIDPYWDQERGFYVSERKQLTGRWLVYRDASWSSVHATEAAAHTYLDNRLRGLAVLEAAPQLFIAV